MVYAKRPHACAITPADMDAVKSALEVILGQDIKPTHRLEIFARLAGFRTYASLSAYLTGQIDIFGDPIPAHLQASLRAGDPFIASLPMEIRRRLAKLEQIGILKMVAAALQICRDPLFGDIGITSEDIDRIQELAQSYQSEGAPRSYATPLPTGHLLLLVSPANLGCLKTGALFGKADPGEGEPVDGKTWHAGSVVLGERCYYFEQPGEDDMWSFVPEDQSWISRVSRETTLVFFSNDDRDAFIASVQESSGRAIDPRACVTVRDLALEIDDDDEEGSIFTLGYYGAARNDLPKDHTQICGSFAVLWLSEIASLVHGFAIEWSRMRMGDAA